MRAEIRQVVTFSSDPRGGNPAFVLAVDALPETEDLRAACALLRADVLAVVARPGDAEPSLRFVTPEGPHPGAGHAALAAAHLALEGQAGDALSFRLDDGRRLRAWRESDRIAIGWQALPFAAFADDGALERALGARPLDCLEADFGVVAVFASEAEVADLDPDMGATSALGRALIATAPGMASDIIIRVFAPHAGLPEDPVCGTAHRIVVPYWAVRLNRSALHSRHLSRRGGDLFCVLERDTVTIAGETLATLRGTIAF